MTPEQFCKRVQRQLLLVEHHTAKLHALLEDGAKAWRPELESMGVDVTPFSGGTNKPPVKED